MIARVTSVHRHRTAISRAALSYPARQALQDGVVTGKVLDFGSGRGGDSLRLTELGFEVAAWDPHFSPGRPAESDTVLMTYVVNVIEDPAERRAALAEAWRLSRNTLVVSARLIWDKRRVRGTAHEDGIVTSRNTFQHLFSSEELRAFVAEMTGAKVLQASPGVVYAFRDDRERLAFLSRRVARKVDWVQSEDSQTALASLVSFAEDRGRMALLEEMPDDVLHFTQHIRYADLKRAVTRAADPDKTADAQRRSTLNALLLLGMEVFNGRGRFSDLPLSVQADVRSFFQSYREACQRADRLLLKLRDDTYLRGAMRNSPGKLTPTALYVHARATDGMPVVLRLYEHCAAMVAGRPRAWNIIKLAHNGRRVSWLDYPEFDSDPHPRLASSYHVDLFTLKTGYSEYTHSSNRPLLHRKHEFLAAGDPDAAKCRRLTEAEVRAGLYRRPELIGTEQGWEEVLERNGVVLKGHRLVHRTN